MSTAASDAVEQLVGDLTRSGRWWGDKLLLSVDDFGYQPVSIVEADGDIAINIPSGPPQGRPDAAEALFHRRPGAPPPPLLSATPIS